ncbi:MAG TPA: hypothetical protein VK935_09185, partial [Actinomycetospora sp.]|nr:hypothetical protein [Actinomycetospora sp.]
SVPDPPADTHRTREDTPAMHALHITFTSTASVEQLRGTAIDFAEVLRTVRRRPVAGRSARSRPGGPRRSGRRRDR